MKQRLTTREKLVFIEEIKANVLNAFGDTSDELGDAVDEVMEKLKNLSKLSEMTSKTKIEKTFVAHLAMSLASKMEYHKDPMDLILLLSQPKPKQERLNRLI